MDANFRQGEQASRSEREYEAWIEKAEGLTGMNLLMSDDALIAFEDGATPEQFNEYMMNGGTSSRTI